MSEPNPVVVVLGAVLVAALGAFGLAAAVNGVRGGRARAHNPREASWSDYIRGEWWIDQYGQATFADGDVGDDGHEVIAVRNMLNAEVLVEAMIEERRRELESLQAKTDPTDDELDFIDEIESVIAALEKKAKREDYDGAYYYFNESIPDEAGIAAAGSKEAWEDLQSDARFAYAKHTGAIQVVDDYFMAWTVTNTTISRIQDFLWEQAEGAEITDPDTEITIEQKHPQRHVRLPIAELLTIKNTRQLWAYGE